MSSITPLVGIYLLSTPVRECVQDVSYGKLISAMLNKSYDGGAYVRSVGATITVWSLLHHKGAQSFLVNKVLRYMGDISFSFYLVHGPIICCLFHSLIPYIYEPTDDGTYDG